MQFREAPDHTPGSVDASQSIQPFDGVALHHHEVMIRSLTLSTLMGPSFLSVPALSELCQSMARP